MDSRKQFVRRRTHAGGFTLIEAVVAILLVGIGIVAVFGGMRSLAAADSKAKTAELLQRLAQSKVEELESATDPTTVGSGGDYSQQGYPNITWTVDLETSATDNLDKMTVTAIQGNEQQSLIVLLFIPPATGTSTGAGGA